MISWKRCFGLGGVGAAASLVINMLVAATVAPPAVSAGLHAPNGDIRLLPNLKVPTRDGVNLSTDIYFPKGPGPFPIILIRTSYDKNKFRPLWVAQSTSSLVKSDRTAAMSSREPAHVSNTNPVDFFVGAGYAVVIQDLRGLYESGGVHGYAKTERRDFEDTAKWLDAQSWSARRMGMYGCSYLAHVQVVGAVTDTPSLKTINPLNTEGSWQSALGRYSGLATYTGGAREHASMFSWFFENSNNTMVLKPDPAVDPETQARFAHFYDVLPDYKVDPKILWDLPLLGSLDRAGLPPTQWNTVVSNPPESKYWIDDTELVNEKDKMYTPSLWVYNWNDYLSGEAIDGFQWAKKNAANATARDNQYLIMGPRYHCDTLRERSEQVDDLELGDTRFPIWETMLKWNNRWVKGDVHAIDGLPKVTYWLYGKNEWRTSPDMPVPGTRYREMYLSSQTGANSLNGDGKLSFDRPRTSSRDNYRYDPADPVPTGSSRTNYLGAVLSDERSIEARKDVLVYTSEPLKKGLTVVGPIKMVLHVASSAIDTDFTGKLVDVYPDGRAIQLQVGILRARYRYSFLKPEMMTPGKTNEITVDLQATANWFAPGHRLRLEVSSSNFPRFDRNLNTGGDTYTETKGVVAQNAVFSGPSTPSHLILPIAPD